MSSTRGFSLRQSAVAVLTVLLLAFAAQAGTYTWNSTSSGNWSDTSASGWNTSGTDYPNGAGDLVYLTSDITAGTTVTIDVADAKLGILYLTDGGTGTLANWTIASSNGTNALTFDRGSSSSSIQSTTGSNTVSAPIVISGTGTGLGLRVTGTQLTLSGVISEGATAGRAFSTDSSTTGTVVVSNANTYTGPTTISGGILSTNLLANGGVASGIGMSSNDAANLVLNGGTLQYTGPAVTIDRNFSLPQGSSSGGTLDASGTGALTITGNVTGGTTGTKYLYLTGTNTDANTLSGAIADGSGSTTRLYKTGTGTWALSGNNTYSNSTNVNEGVLLLNSANALPGGIGSSGGTSALLINGGVVGLGHGDFSRDVGTGVDEVRFSGSGGFAAYGADRAVNLGGAGATVTWNVGYFLPTDSSLILGAATADHMVDFQNPINLTGGDRTIQVNNGSAAVDAKISGEISGTAGIGNVVKTGDGTLLLTANNTYTGTTTISAGTLLVDGSLADSAVSVNGGVLGGSGVVNGSVVVASGANLAPGNSPGSLELGSALNLQSGSTLVIELGGTTFTLNGTEQYDRVKVTGATTLAGALNVSLIDAFTPNAGDLFGIVDATGGLTGTFGNYAEGDTVLTSGGVIVKITYLGNVTDSTVSQTGGSDVVLYAVPEPASMALLLLGGGLALLRRRR